MKKVKFSTVVAEAIDYLLLGEKSNLVLEGDLKLQYDIVKSAFMDIVKEMEQDVVVVCDEHDAGLEDIAVALVAEAKSEAKRFLEQKKEIFVEVCKKRAKKKLKETGSIEDASQHASNEVYTEICMLFMSVFPLVVEGAIADNLSDDIRTAALKNLTNELVSIASQYRPCCGK